MDKTIPSTMTAALAEVFEINRELGHAAALVNPELHIKSRRSAYLIDLLDGVASSGKWPARRGTA